MTRPPGRRGGGGSRPRQSKSRKPKSTGDGSGCGNMHAFFMIPFALVGVAIRLALVHIQTRGAA